MVHLTFTFPDPLVVKNSEDVDAPTYETLDSGVNVDASIYQSLNGLKTWLHKTYLFLFPLAYICAPHENTLFA